MVLINSSIQINLIQFISIFDYYLTKVEKVKKYEVKKTTNRHSNI